MKEDNKLNVISYISRVYLDFDSVTLYNNVKFSIPWTVYFKLKDGKKYFVNKEDCLTPLP
jgi:hypothetical protein